MRPYRAIPIGKKDFVYGWYAERQDSHYNPYSVIIEDALEFEVIPETVGQQVGRKDINNKEVYRGDRVKIIGHKCRQIRESDHKTVCNVVWFDEAGGWMLDCIDGKHSYGYYNTAIVEIIGNIHQEQNNG